MVLLCFGYNTEKVLLIVSFNGLNIKWFEKGSLEQLKGVLKWGNWIK